MRAQGKILHWTCLVVSIIFPGHAWASVIDSTFISGNQYICCSGYQAYGSVPTGGPFASAFTPTQTYTLSEIDVAVWNSTASEPFTLSIDQGSGGQPGITLESWSLNSVGAPASGPVTVGPTTVASAIDTLSLTLLAGDQYWIVISTPSVAVYWNVNSMTGPDVTFGSYNAGAWHFRAATNMHRPNSTC